MKILGCVVNCVKELRNLKKYDYYHDGYGSSRKPHKKVEKTEQQKEWEQWEEDHKKEQDTI